MGMVKVTVAKDGSTAKVEVDGILGSGCKTLTEGLIQAMGESVETEDTHEFYQSEQIEETVGV